MDWFYKDRGGEGEGPKGRVLEEGRGGHSGKGTMAAEPHRQVPCPRYWPRQVPDNTVVPAVPSGGGVDLRTVFKRRLLAVIDMMHLGEKDGIVLL